MEEIRVIHRFSSSLENIFRTNIGQILPPQETVIKVYQLFGALMVHSTVNFVIFFSSLVTWYQSWTSFNQVDITLVKFNCICRSLWHPSSQLRKPPISILPRLLPYVQWWLPAEVFWPSRHHHYFSVHRIKLGGLLRLGG